METHLSKVTIATKPASKAPAASKVSTKAKVKANTTSKQKNTAAAKVSANSKVHASATSKLKTISKGSAAGPSSSTPTSSHNIGREADADEDLDLDTIARGGNGIVSHSGKNESLRSKCVFMIERFAIDITGCRSGEILIGSSKATEGGQLRVLGAVEAGVGEASMSSKAGDVANTSSLLIPPDKNKLEKIRQFPDLWGKFLKKLEILPIYRNLAASGKANAVEEFLKSLEDEGERSISEYRYTRAEGRDATCNSTTRNLCSSSSSKDSASMSDVPVVLQILQPPPVLSESGMSDIDLQQILAAPMAGVDIEEKIPRKAGSSAARHTLAFIKSFWKIVLAHEVVEKFDGLVLDVRTGELRESSESSVQGINESSGTGGNRIRLEPQIFIVSGVPHRGRDRKISNARFGIRADKLVKSTAGEDSATWTSLTKGEMKRQLFEQLRSKCGLGSLPGSSSSSNTLDYDPAFVKSLFEGFTPAYHKSLIQKIIRFTPAVVQVPRRPELARPSAIPSESRPPPSKSAAANIGSTWSLNFEPDPKKRKIIYLDSSDEDASPLDSDLVWRTNIYDPYPAAYILLLSMLELAFHPGSFVPDIQRYVTGLESLTKRLAIIALEDSWIDVSDAGEDGDARTLVSLLSASLLAQRVRSWKPDPDLLQRWLEFGMKLWERDGAYIDYDLSRGAKLEAFVVEACDKSEGQHREQGSAAAVATSLQLGSALLDIVRSFEGDLQLFRDTAKHFSKIVKGRHHRHHGPESCSSRSQNSKVFHHSMFLEHCLDQHCFANIAYFYEPAYLEKFDQARRGRAASGIGAVSLSKPYLPLFDAIFTKVTGVNPRRHFSSVVIAGSGIPAWEKDEFVKATQCAQRAAFAVMQPHQFSSQGADSPESQVQRLIGFKTLQNSLSHSASCDLTLHHALDRSWIAGLVGPIEHRGKPNVVVTMKTEDPAQLVAMAKPARETREVGLSDARQTEAIEYVLNEALGGEHGGVMLGRMKTGYLPEELVGWQCWFRKMGGESNEGENAEGEIANGGDESSSSYEVCVRKPGDPDSIRTWEEARNICVKVPVYERVVSQEVEINGCHKGTTNQKRAVYAIHQYAATRHMRSSLSGLPLGICTGSAALDVEGFLQEWLIQPASNSPASAIADDVQFDPAVELALPLLRTFDSSIKLPALSKTGSGTEQAVSGGYKDVQVFHFLCAFSCRYPMALLPSRSNGLEFKIACPPLLWEIAGKMQECMLNKGKLVRATGVETIPDSPLKRNISNSGHMHSAWDRLLHSTSVKAPESALESATAKDIIFSPFQPSKPIFQPLDSRVPWTHQTDTVDDMLRLHALGRKGNFLWIPAGMGKTSIVMWYLSRRLRDFHSASSRLHQPLPDFIVYALPSSALQSVLIEIQNFNVPCQLLFPIKGFTDEKSSAKRLPKGVKVVRDVLSELRPGVINLIEHDHVVKCLPEICNAVRASQSQSESNGRFLFIVDEVHKTLSKQTLRTSSTLTVAQNADEFIAFTGTPVINNNIFNLLDWMKMMLPFELNVHNCLVAMNSMISRKIATKVKVVKESVWIDLVGMGKTRLKNGIQSPSNNLNTAAGNGSDISDPQVSLAKEYVSLVPSRKFGGTNDYPSSKDIMRALEICWEVCDRKMVDMCGDCIKHKKIGSVMLVGRNMKHQVTLAELLVAKKIVRAEDILIIGKEASRTSKGQVRGSLVPKAKAKGTSSTCSTFSTDFTCLSSVFLTDDSVKSKLTPDYKIVITSIQRAEGYTLSRLGAMVTSVYPSNQASREQMEGRINRMSQQRGEIRYYTVHCGLLSSIMKNHETARNLSEALKSLAVEIEMNRGEC
eukprot:TRINITY_DN10813_c0_g1_i1.p1 TRINITY_DN10813_c0_g1~~TRINITY_DN10813_c0_g1_i1.p1  ORF type:complete len:1825 (-),score=219.70 TRINITY_DN10813_c0_g1_i1:7-5481(-)